MNISVKDEKRGMAATKRKKKPSFRVRLRDSFHRGGRKLGEPELKDQASWPGRGRRHAFPPKESMSGKKAF